MLTKFSEYQRFITMLSINCLKIANFYNLKLCIKNEFMNHIVNHICINFDVC